MSDAPPPPPPSAPPPPPPSDGIGALGLDGPPPIPGSAPAPAPYDPAAPPAYTAGYGETPTVDPGALRIANPAWRALAFALDGLGTFAVTTIIVFVGLFAGAFEVFSAIGIVPLLSAVLATVLTATLGVTPGKAIVGIRVVHVETGRPIGAWAILRSLVIISPLVVAVLLSGLLSTFRYNEYSAVGSSGVFNTFSDLSPYLPFAGWLALLIVLILRPHHRGLEDLVARSIVVRR